MKAALTLDRFLETLDEHRECVPIDDLVDLMTKLDIRLADVASFVRFSPEQYRRNLVRLGDGYAALVLCWRPGQRSPIHDHRGSACGVMVLDGVASEHRYRLGARGGLEATESFSYPTGRVCGSFDADIHEIANESRDHDLVTLHVYTPPMKNYRVYDKGGGSKLYEDDETNAAQRARTAAVR